MCERERERESVCVCVCVCVCERERERERLELQPPDARPCSLATQPFTPHPPWCFQLLDCRCLLVLFAKWIAATFFGSFVVVEILVKLSSFSLSVTLDQAPKTLAPFLLARFPEFS